MSLSETSKSLDSLNARILARRQKIAEAGGSVQLPPVPEVPAAVTAAPMLGLGDLVAVVARPIGDALGLDPAKCGCNQRQDWLNKLLPFR